MARDAHDPGGESAAALVTLIKREFDTRGPVGDRGLAAEADVLVATRQFPLPPELTAEREAVEEVERTLDGIDSAVAEVMSGGRQHDHTESIERINAGEPLPEVTVAVKPERVMPFMIARDLAPTDQPNDAA
jgi:hypothetical protein